MVKLENDLWDPHVIHYFRSVRGNCLTLQTVESRRVAVGMGGGRPGPVCLRALWNGHSTSKFRSRPRQVPLAFVPRPTAELASTTWRSSSGGARGSLGAEAEVADPRRDGARARRRGSARWRAGRGRGERGRRIEEAAALATTETRAALSATKPWRRPSSARRPMMESDTLATALFVSSGHGRGRTAHKTAFPSRSRTDAPVREQAACLLLDREDPEAARPTESRGVRPSPVLALAAARPRPRGAAGEQRGRIRACTRAEGFFFPSCYFTKWILGLVGDEILCFCKKI